MLSTSPDIFVMKALASLNEIVFASTSGMMVFNCVTSARSVGVDEKVGNPVILAVPSASCWLNGTAGFNKASRVDSLMPIWAA